LKRADQAFEEGVQQIWLTSEDTGAYGLDLVDEARGIKKGDITIVTLLEALVARVPEGKMLRLGMTNPPYMARHAKKVAEVLAHPCVFEFLHVPVQSGCDEVLKNMRREYTSAVFSRMCDQLRSRNPTMTLATDIICGFPGETDDSHVRTLDLIKKFHFPILNVSQFYPRPGTEAAKPDFPKARLRTDIVKQRSTEVTSLFLSYHTYDRLVGMEKVRVWFSGTEQRKSKTTGELIQQTVGHTKQHVKVVVPRDDRLLGENRYCKILSSCKWHVNAELID